MVFSFVDILCTGHQTFCWKCGRYSVTSNFDSSRKQTIPCVSTSSWKHFKKQITLEHTFTWLSPKWELENCRRHYFRNHWTVSTLKKTIDCIWILCLLMWPFGAARLVTWHYFLTYIFIINPLSEGHYTACRKRNFASKWMLTEELFTVGNQLERMVTVQWFR